MVLDSRSVEAPNDSSELVSGNRAAESEEPQNDLPGQTSARFRDLTGVQQAMDKVHSSNESLEFDELLSEHHR